MHDGALLLFDAPTWWQVLGFLLGLFVAYLVLGVAIFHFADWMRRRARRDEALLPADELTGDRDDAAASGRLDDD